MSRRRRLLELTDTGRSALEEWLTTPTDRATRVHDDGLLRLYFSRSATDRDQVTRLARDQLALHRTRLEHLERLAGPDGVPERTLQRATLEMGLRLERLALEFWDDVATGRVPTDGAAGES